MKGKFLIVVGDEEAEKVLEILRGDPLGKKSAIIGEIVPERKNVVILNTSIGGKRILDMPSVISFPESVKKNMHEIRIAEDLFTYCP